MSPDWSPSTVLETRRIIDTKLQALGKVRLDKITPAYLDQFYARLRAAGGAAGRPLAPATVRRIHVVVRAALEQECVELDRLQPCSAGLHRPGAATAQPCAGCHGRCHAS